MTGEGADWGNVVKNQAVDAVESEVKQVLIEKASQFITDMLPQFLNDAIVAAGSAIGFRRGRF